MAMFFKINIVNKISDYLISKIYPDRLVKIRSHRSACRSRSITHFFTYNNHKKD